MARIINSREFGFPADAQISSLEARLGIKLPAEYRSFLTEHNGGIPSPDRFYVSEIEDFMTVETFFGLHAGPRHVNLESHIEGWGMALLPDHLPIGYEQGGNPICLSLVVDGLGRIDVWDEQLDRVQGVQGPLTFYKVAPSLAAFMESLR